MNYIFFLIPLLLIPIYDAAAYRGENYEDIDNGNNTHTWTGGLSPWVETGYTDSEGRPLFTHHVVVEDANSVTVHNGEASFVFDKNTCSAKIYSGGTISDTDNFVLGSDSYVPKSSVNGTGTWNTVTSVNNAACVTNVIETADSIQVSGTKTSAAGIFKVIYLKEDGKPLKTILEATNLSALTDRQFGVTQTQDVPRIITWAGDEKDLANFVGQTFDREFLENNQANLLEFSQGLQFDVIDAWQNLESVKINSVNGNTASISFNYLRNAPILLPNDTLVIDPTFSSNNPTMDGYVVTTSTAGTSCSTTASSTNTASNLDMKRGDSDISDNCQWAFIEWNITSIPNDATILDTDFDNYIRAIGSGTPTCNISQIDVQLSPATSQARLDELRTAATMYISGGSFCQTVGSYSLDLGATADSYIDNTSLGVDWFAVGFNFASMTRDSTARTSTMTSEEGAESPKPTLTVTYTIYPDGITDLTYANLEQTALDLLWTEPNLNNGTLVNYRINYTTPYGSPLTFLANSTNTYLNVTGLNDATPYSFRVMALTEFGYGEGGNILNVTTSEFMQIGNLSSPDVTNTDDFQIFFERDDINATALYLNVTYADTYNLSCDFAYQLARTNNTYSNLTSTAVPPDELESSFLLINATDIIHVRCYDEITGDSSNYVITITDFPLLEQIRNLRNGTYGTAFSFGAIDGVILVVIFLSMIGFNRTSPAAGVIFMVITVGVLSYFEIITYPIIMYPALALLVLWAVITTRKDD